MLLGTRTTKEVKCRSLCLACRLATCWAGRHRSCRVSVLRMHPSPSRNAEMRRCMRRMIRSGTGTNCAWYTRQDASTCRATSHIFFLEVVSYTMEPVVHSIKRSSGRMGQPVVTPTPRHPLCRSTIAGPCRQLREKQPRRASRA